MSSAVGRPEPVGRSNHCFQARRKFIGTIAQGTSCNKEVTPLRACSYACVRRSWAAALAKLEVGKKKSAHFFFFRHATYIALSFLG